jgi:hypothetical protein
MITKGNKKGVWVLFLMCFLAIVRLGGASIFLFDCCKKLIFFLNVNVGLVTTWLLGKGIIYTKLDVRGT